MPDPTTPPIFDGVRPPAPSTPNASKPPELTPSAGNRGLTILIVFLVGIYVLGGFVLMALLPSNNPALEALGSLGTMIYGLGLAAWLGIGLIALFRIMSVKTSPRVQRRALVRLVMVEFPVIITSFLVLFLINREPAILLDILSPTTQSQFIAPVSVTYGTATANEIFRRKGISVVRYLWDFEGDGKINLETTEPQVTGYYPREGIYYVRAVAELSNGTTKTLTRTIQIPRTQFAITPEQPIIGEPATFSVTHMFMSSESQKEFVGAKWDFDGDGSYDIEDTKFIATYIYRRTGTFEVTVEVSNRTNATTTFKRSVTVIEPPKQPFPVALRTVPTTLLSPVPFGVVFNVETDEPLSNVVWDFGDEKNAETKEGVTALHTFEKVGNFIVTATVRSQSGAVAKLTKLVRVTEPLQLPDLQFTGSPEVKGSTITGQLPLTLDITPKTGQPLITFSWDAPDASEVLSTEKTLRAVYRKEGEYMVELIGIDTDQKVLRKRITVKVNPPAPQVTVRIDPTSPIAPENVKFDASDTFINDQTISGFEWDFGDGESKKAGAQVTHVYDEPGKYIVKVKAITIEGESYATEVTLVVREPLRDVCFLPSRNSGRAPLGVNFDTSCSTSGFVKWEWDFGDASQSREQNPAHVFVQEGEFVVTLRATDEDGRVMENKTTITVTSP